MTQLRIVCITMVGHEYALFDGAFPEGPLGEGESPANGARRIVREWTATEQPKLELVDMIAARGAFTLVMRAILVSEPRSDVRKLLKARRMELPPQVGALEGKYVEEALKTSLAYKLTRP